MECEYKREESSAISGIWEEITLIHQQNPQFKDRAFYLQRM